MWKTLRHPNVLLLIGAIMTETQFAVVSEWMVNETINGFVKEHPSVDRIGLVGFSTKSPAVVVLLIIARPSSSGVLRGG